jgi:hypothetical protein
MLTLRFSSEKDRDGVTVNVMMSAAAFVVRTVVCAAVSDATRTRTTHCGELAAVDGGAGRAVNKEFGVIGQPVDGIVVLARVQEAQVGRVRRELPSALSSLHRVRATRSRSRTVDSLHEMKLELSGSSNMTTSAEARLPANHARPRAHQCWRGRACRRFPYWGRDRRRAGPPPAAA